MKTRRALATLFVGLLISEGVFSCMPKQVLADTQGSEKSSSGSCKSQSIVLGEAIVKSQTKPEPSLLARQSGLADLKVTEISPVFDKYYLVKFTRVEAGGEMKPDETYTLKVVAAFAKLEGIESSEPNRIVRPAAK